MLGRRRCCRVKVVPLTSPDGTVSYAVEVLDESGRFSGFPSIELDGVVLEFL